jgi:hypothetical protein
MAAKAVIAAEVERLHWRIWNGKAKNARKSINRIRVGTALTEGTANFLVNRRMVVSHFQRKGGRRKSIALSRKLWTALHALDGSLAGQSSWLADYAERHRVGSCAVYNGTLGSGLGQKFRPANDLYPPIAIAA